MCRVTLNIISTLVMLLLLEATAKEKNEEAEVKMDGDFLHVFGVGKLGHDRDAVTTVSWSILSIFLRFVRV